MSRPVTHEKGSPGWRSRSISAAASARIVTRIGREPREKRARGDWIDAMSARKAVQSRIVETFGHYVEGSGPEPTDELLLTFVRAAIAEQRLVRRLR